MRSYFDIQKPRPLFLLLILTLCLYSLQAQVSYEQPLKATESGVGFLLRWSTSSEESNQLYSIERSTDGIEFKSLGFVESKKGEGVQEYEFKDLDLGLEKVSYRLKLTSIDGTISFSDPLTLNKQYVNYYEVVHKKKISDELFQVSVNTVKEGELECRLTSNMGDILFDESKPLKLGLNDYLFDLSSEMDGTYNVIFKLGNVMETVVLKKETKDKKGNVASKKSGSKGG